MAYVNRRATTTGAEAENDRTAYRKANGDVWLMLFNRHFRDIIESHFDTSEEAYKFALWCFGEGFEKIYREDLPKRWNALHGNKLKIQGSGRPEEDIVGMKALYIEEKEMFR